MGASTSFPYSTGSELCSTPEYTCLSGTRKEDSTSVTIFKFSPVTFRAENFARRIKTLRHPLILNYLDEALLEDTLYVVTESASPLEIRSIEPSLLALGLAQLSSCLAFLNDSGLIHGAVSCSSIFITKTGDWKLAGLQNTVEATMGSRIDLSSLPDRYLPPESRSAVCTNPVHSLDAWSTACLIQELFNGEFTRPQQLSNLGNIPEALHNEYKRLLATKPSTRLSLDGLRKSKYFQTDLIRTIDFLDNLALKNDSQKESFYKHLPDIIEHIPTPVAKYKLLPLLTHALLYGSGSAKVLTSLLLLSQSLTSTEFQVELAPALTKLYASNERAIRVALLKNLSSYIHHLDEKTVDSDIFPHVKTGFTDTVSIMREWTVKSLVSFVPKLRDKTLQTSVLPFIPRLQKDPEPAIRTNTIVVVGRIAKHLTASLRNRLLLSTFSRALRDPFNPARKSALVAFKATIDFYTPHEIATGIIPIIAMHTIDPVREVRDAAFVTLNLLVNVLADNSKELVDPEPVELQDRKASIDEDSGMLGSISSWAVNSIKSSVGYGGDPAPAGDPQPISGIAHKPPTALNPESTPQAIPPVAPIPQVYDFEDDADWSEPAIQTQSSSQVDLFKFDLLNSPLDVQEDDDPFAMLSTHSNNSNTIREPIDLFSRAPKTSLKSKSSGSKSSMKPIVKPIGRVKPASVTKPKEFGKPTSQKANQPKKSGIDDGWDSFLNDF